MGLPSAPTGLLLLLLVTSALPVMTSVPAVGLEPPGRDQDLLELMMGGTEDTGHADRYVNNVQRQDVLLVPENSLQALGEGAAQPDVWPSQEEDLLASKRTQELQKMLEKIHNSVLTVGRERDELRQRERNTGQGQDPSNSFLRIGRRAGTSSEGIRRRIQTTGVGYGLGFPVYGGAGDWVTSPSGPSVGVQGMGEGDREDMDSLPTWRGATEKRGGENLNAASLLAYLRSSRRRTFPRWGRSYSPRTRFMRFGRSHTSTPQRHSLGRIARSTDQTITARAGRSRMNSFLRFGRQPSTPGCLERAGRGGSHNSFVRIGKAPLESSAIPQRASRAPLNSFLRIGREPELEPEPASTVTSPTDGMDTDRQGPDSVRVSQTTRGVPSNSFLRRVLEPELEPASGATPPGKTDSPGPDLAKVSGTPPADEGDTDRPGPDSVRASRRTRSAHTHSFVRIGRQSEEMEDLAARVQYLSDMLRMSRRSFVRIGKLPSSAFLLRMTNGKLPDGTLAHRRSPGFRLSETGFVRMGKRTGRSDY